jgi:hypothetical protein
MGADRQGHHPDEDSGQCDRPGGEAKRPEFHNGHFPIMLDGVRKSRQCQIGLRESLTYCGEMRSFCGTAT